MIGRSTPPELRRLTALYAVDGLLEWAASIALLVWFYDQTGSALATGLLLVAKQAIPGLLIATIGGRLEPVGTTRGAIAGLLLRAAAAPAAIATGNPWLALALVPAAGLGGAITRVSFRTHVALRWDGAERHAANSALNLVMGGVSLLGPPIAAGIVAATSPIWLLGAAGIVAILVAFTLPAALRVPALPARTGGDANADPDADRDAPANALQPASVNALEPAEIDARAPAEAEPSAAAPGPAHHVSPAVLLGCAAVVLAALAMDEPSLLPYATEALHGTASDYALILSAWGLGIIVGGLAFSRLAKHNMFAVAAGGASIAAAAYLGLGAAPTVEVAVAVAVLGGLGNGIDWVAFVTALQSITGAEQQGQLAARLEGVVGLAPPIGYVVGGWLADAAGPRAPLLAGGAIVLGAVVLTGWLMRRSGRAAASSSASPSAAASAGATANAGADHPAWPATTPALASDPR